MKVNSSNGYLAVFSVLSGMVANIDTVTPTRLFLKGSLGGIFLSISRVIHPKTLRRKRFRRISHIPFKYRLVH